MGEQRETGGRRSRARKCRRCRRAGGQGMAQRRSQRRNASERAMTAREDGARHSRGHDEQARPGFQPLHRLAARTLVRTTFLSHARCQSHASPPPLGLAAFARGHGHAKRLPHMLSAFAMHSLLVPPTSVHLGCSAAARRRENEQRAEQASRRASVCFASGLDTRHETLAFPFVAPQHQHHHCSFAPRLLHGEFTRAGAGLRVPQVPASLTLFLRLSRLHHDVVEPVSFNLRYYPVHFGSSMTDVDIPRLPGNGSLVFLCTSSHTNITSLRDLRPNAAA
ncbi:hypothetical protein K491DRAFT_673681 [Lophiostoma macrostomum CBS 122681]|uniref:Uncharacterized protein n=1 Tax=Lophiostoma macrostomum CBS 122681 TaxID=1314788 RepID=A0A6A6TPN4_9PLEO|nr:hypothetical protein K491DRAFT_673681 [Lophiostoma macrostomum CBS 122681]